jgi:hypothetical protein
LVFLGFVDLGFARVLPLAVGRRDRELDERVRVLVEPRVRSAEVARVAMFRRLRHGHTRHMRHTP